VPGASGQNGENGSDGSDGISSYTSVATQFVIPSVDANVTIQVADSSGFSPGQNIYIQNAGYFQFVSSTSSTNATVKNLGASANLAVGTIVAAGNKMSPAGPAFGGVASFSATYGAGSPEGVVVGSIPDMYWDTTNQVFYIKKSGTGTNTGWQELVAVPV
jgi:hypothetical protein